MKAPFQIVPYTWPKDQPGQLEPHPIPYIARGQQVFAIYQPTTGQFFRWAYPSSAIAIAVAKNLAGAQEHSANHWDMTPHEVVIPKIYANLPGIQPSPEPMAPTSPELIYINH